MSTPPIASVEAIPLQTLPNGIAVRSLNRAETEFLYREIFVEESYVRGHDPGLRDRPVVVDVGANIGLFTLYAARTWPGARVLAIEPAPAVVAALRANVADLPGVTVHPVALGERPATATLTYYPGFTTMSGIGADPAADREVVRSVVAAAAEDIAPEQRDAFLQHVTAHVDAQFDGARPVVCEVRRLDDLAEEAGLDRIDLLKVDVEGMELAVLQGVSASWWQRIGAAVVEVADRDGRLDRVTGLLREHGLRVAVEQVTELRSTDMHTVFAHRED
jgi:31-O-methyltransferase